MDETGNKTDQAQADGSKYGEGYAIADIRNIPVMESALDVISLLGGGQGVVVRAKGNAIPSAVAVANIITENMMAGKCKIQNITLDTDGSPGMGRMLSTIEIVLCRP